MGLAAEERTALSDLLLQVGPDQPTLCAGWDTEDLLSHLLIRERRPDAALGQLIGSLKGHAEKVVADIEARQWADRIATLRSGPPGWNPMGWGPLEEASNGAEFFVHHEDVRRGRSGWEPRELPAQTEAAVDKLLRSKFAGMVSRSLGVGVVGVLPGGERIEIRSGTPVIQVHGAAQEIVLWVFGRDAARVELVADEATLQKVRSARS